MFIVIKNKLIFILKKKNKGKKVAIHNKSLQIVDIQLYIFDNNNRF